VKDNDIDSSDDDIDYSMDVVSLIPNKEEMEQALLAKQKEEVLRNFLTPALQRAILAEKS
jgi:hypothetical protein